MILVLLDFVILGKQGNLKSIWIMYLWEAVIAACQTVPPPYILLQVNFYETILFILIWPIICYWFFLKIQGNCFNALCLENEEISTIDL